MNNKRGLSNVIVVVLLILLAIAAVSIMWGVLSNVLQRTGAQLSTATDCLEIKLEVVSANYDKINKELSATIQRNIGRGDLQKIKFLIDNQLLQNVLATNEDATSLGELGTKLATLRAADNELPPRIGIASGSKLTIYPVVKDALGNDKHCIDATSKPVTIQ